MTGVRDVSDFDAFERETPVRAPERVRSAPATPAPVVDDPDVLDSADRFVSAAGLGIRVRVTGAGPPLLMINGLGANIELWGPLTPLLASRALIRFDSPGSGLSTV